MVLFVKRISECADIVSVPDATGIANNPEEPRPCVPPFEGMEVAKGPQRRLLHDIFRIVLVPHQPSCEPVRRFEVRQDDDIKALGIR